MTTQDFIEESWKIEGLSAKGDMPMLLELHEKFEPTVEYMTVMAAQITGGYGRLRDKPGMDVMVGRHMPPAGGADMKDRLRDVLNLVGFMSPYRVHKAFEQLHPFMDGNGRVGRALWLHTMGYQAPLGFLHQWYYQSLSNGRIQ